MEDLNTEYKRILDRIQSVCHEVSRPVDSVKLIAVSKTQPFEKIEVLYRLGQRDFGENYAQELVDKAKQAESKGLNEIRWHMIGHLQTNKVKMILPYVHAIHSVDSEKLALEIDKRADRKINVLIEVNLDAESSKSGIAPEEVATLVASLTEMKNLVILGLMAIPSRTRTGGLKAAFKKLKSISDTLSTSTKKDLSMGMSQDYEAAIEEGSTFIRIGTALFGTRR